MGRRQRIVFADGDDANLSAGMGILCGKYDVFPAATARQLLDSLENMVPDLLLLDTDAPDFNGYDVIRSLKGDTRFVDIPVLLLVSAIDEHRESEGLSMGALDYIRKPLSAPVLLKRIENCLAIVSHEHELRNLNHMLKDFSHRQANEFIAMQNSMIVTIADMAELRDYTTAGHIARTKKYLELLTGQLLAENIYMEEISAWDLAHFFPSAQLHDVGKMAVSELILNKPSKLSIAEFNEVKRHPAAGVDVLRKIDPGIANDKFMSHAMKIAGTHHEKWDGTGYPSGLRGTGIPLEGRLMAVADVYDALVSARPFKKPLSGGEAERIIISGKGAHFDPVLVEAFKKVAPQFALVAMGYR